MDKEEQELASTLAMMSSTQSPDADAGASPASETDDAKNGATVKIEPRIAKQGKRQSSEDKDNNDEDNDEDEDYVDEEDHAPERASANAPSGAHVDEATHSGRFSEEEKNTLFGLILKDPDLFRAFVHQLTKRKWGGRSWMNEIAKRFNQLVPYQRKHDAVRHHLKLRKARSPGTGSDEDIIESLLEHSLDCHKSDTCSKCLSLHRVRVRLGFASCGWPDCEHCDNSKPHVLRPFDARTLLRQIRAQGGVASLTARGGSSNAEASSGKGMARGNRRAGAGLPELQTPGSANGPSGKAPAPLTMPELSPTNFHNMAPGFPGVMPFSPFLHSPLSPMLQANLRAIAFNSPKSARTDRSDSSSSTGSEVTQQLPGSTDAASADAAQKRFLAAQGDAANLIALQMLLNTPKGNTQFDTLSPMSISSTTTFSPTNDTSKLANMFLLAGNNNNNNNGMGNMAIPMGFGAGGMGGNVASPTHGGMAGYQAAAQAVAQAAAATANKTSPSSAIAQSGPPGAGAGLGTLSSLALGAQPFSPAGMTSSSSSSPPTSPSIDRSMVLPFNPKLMELAGQETPAKKRAFQDAFNTIQQEISRCATNSAKQSKLSSS
ncbi:Hypothetical Protein FCC1311_054462 [Hondaea fermentalgiana]|uniref:Uncharacterized protein n=1 Tax=Hondaea fermentalgiana TaxID=2315210 RepID=A0A2R5GMY1_9STRA|nr:Hypothetical Protein FCC1311_054462 [Hondaea fermentalgiana]|eukprot:GBG29224.1 Hypothetical Protein FCC1311_054462 [Hondaea fermentalgiana]